MKSINPTNGTTIRNYREHTDKGVFGIVNRVDKAFHTWKQTSFQLRAELMTNLATLLRSNVDKYAKLITLEMGKIISESRAEVEKCALVCEYYAQNAESFLANEVVSTEFSESYVSFRPIGVILAVMPWNFPFWQVFRCAAPTIMAGNTMILKHASNVTGCSLATEELFHEAGFPDNVFRSLLIRGDRVEPVIAHPAVKAVTLTGSTPAGKAIASAAGRYLKKSLLELGGSDPYIVLEDADLEHAVNTCASSRLLNAGQSCIAAKRFIVTEPVYDKFCKLLKQNFREITWGDPMDEDVSIGPLARPDLREELHHQVQNSVKAGAKLLTGGYIPEGRGTFYPPTILTGVKPGMPAYEEELFGPVAAVIKARNEKEAIKIANDTSFGLAAAVFTKDVQNGKRIAEELIEAGNCFVNDLVRSDPRMPFGGIGNSGYGRELSSYGIREFVNIKAVSVR